MSVLAALLEELHDNPAALAELRSLLEAGPAAYTPQTLARELGVTPRAIRAAIERGDLEARRSGRGYVIGAEAVAAWCSATTRSSTRTAPARGTRTLRDALSG